MNDPLSSAKKRSLWQRLKMRALAVDARFDDSLYRGRTAIGNTLTRLSEASDHVRVHGLARLGVELLSETVTVGIAGLCLLGALAIWSLSGVSTKALRQSELAVTFQDRYGNEIGRRGIRQSTAYGLDDYPDHFIKAVLATEDRRFYDHFGIDAIGTLRAMVVNARSSSVTQGGSSITQQLAKNIFLSNERTLERKIKEAFLALWLEANLSKRDILKMYLERAYMGGGNFGAEAAAEYYFGKSIKEISLAEAAMLAGLFKAPTKFAPHVNLPAARARALTVLDNLVDAGFLSEGQVFGAKRNPATPIDRHDGFSPNYYLDYAFDDVRKIVENTPAITDRVLTVRTGIDVNLQKQTENVMESMLRQHGDSYDVSQGAVVVMDVGGTVRAIVGGRDYGTSQFNRATDAARQPGSSFKPIVYAAAFDAGLITSKSVVVDRPTCLGNWCPLNYNRSYAGSISVTTALVHSINTIPVQLSQNLGKGDARIGRLRIIEMAQKMGIRKPLTNSAPLPIGAAETSLLELTGAYSVFASGGKAMTPHAAIDIRNANHDLVWKRHRDVVPEQVLTPEVAADMNGVLMQIVQSGTGRRAQLDGVPIGGKTGTTNEYRNALFIGFSGQFITGVWYGNDDYSSMNNMTGGTLPAMTFRDVMMAAHRGTDIRPIFGQALPDARPVTAQNGPRGDEADIAYRPSFLQRRSLDVLNRLERQLESRKAQPHAQSAPSAAPALAVMVQ